MFFSSRIIALIAVLSLIRGQDNDKTTRCGINLKELEQLFQESSNVVLDRRTLEAKLSNKGSVIKLNQKVSDIGLIRKKLQDPINRVKELKQLPFEALTKKIIEKYGLSSEEVDICLPSLPLEGPSLTAAIEQCQEDEFSGQCDSGSMFRTADGTCNNLRNPRWGSAGPCFIRLLPANYVGESGFRQSVTGIPLPEPRTLSLNIHSHLNRPTDYVTHMYMFFGQLLDHDITQAPFSVSEDNEALNCCNGEEETLHPQCAPIALQPDDPFYSQFGRTCMNFVRSVICPTCGLGHRQQLNQITAFIDASFVYGNSLNETLNLRSNNGTGRMRVESSPVGDLLPSSPDPLNDQCSFVNTSDICFLAGDSRANQHTVLTSLHTIFVREHNRLADGLRQMNPGWNEERLFQEARKIVGAMMQVITYKEYLPITLGDNRMSYFRLWMSQSGRTVYNGQTDPTLYNEFSAAAFRFGHSLINGIITNMPRNQNNGLRMLRDEFFQPFELRTGLITPLMNGATDSPAQTFDRHLVPDVTNFLFRIRGQPTGLDLASLNIQRGRDHGTPTYVDTVLFCSEGQIRVNTFRDLVIQRLMTEQNMRLLSQNYRNVNDIDLWTGILSETYIDGAVVGPTGACIIGTQFQNLKYGDRFYFEHRNQVGSFTYQQVQELRQMTLSKIICLNTDVRQLPTNAMIFVNRRNQLINCRFVGGVDLSYWRE